MAGTVVGAAKGRVGFEHLPPTSGENSMKDAIYHAAHTRGAADHGWLKARHSFSFASYYNPERMNFGALRVLNDDAVAPARGFGKHPHDNMEIVTIPLYGDLEHNDSTGMRDVIRHGDVQIMSAGSGIYHSEMNPNPDKEVRLLQIWVMPDKRDIPPRYDRKTFAPEGRKDKFQTVVSPNDPEALWINQNAYFSLADLTRPVNYPLFDPQNGVYLFVIEGEVEIEGRKIGRRDALGLWNRKSVSIAPATPAQIVAIEVPMTI